MPQLTMQNVSEIEPARLREPAGSDGDAVLGTLSTEDLLKALDLISRDDQLTVGARLLFGRNNAIARFVPTHEVAFEELDRLEVRVNQWGSPLRPGPATPRSRMCSNVPA